MNSKIKIVVAILPIIIAGTVGGTMAYPAYNDYTAKQAQLEEKKTEEQGLSQKLAGKTKLLKDKKMMEESLEKLRSSIPKKPDLELLNIDVEKMCEESGIDLVSFKDAEKDDFKKAGVEDPNSAPSAAQTALKNSVKAGVKAATAASSTTGAGAASTGVGGASGASGNTDTGLQKITLAVKCIGDYPSLMALTRKLETYQRVVAISSVKTSVPKKEQKNDSKKKLELPDDQPPGEGDEQGDYHRLNISFLLTSYYLP